MKKILFRADGNAAIGAGHVMRCLSIGAAARELEIECVYVTADPSFEKMIQEKGFSCMVMNTLYSDMDSEWAALEHILNQYQPDTVFVDSYYVTSEYLKRLKQYGKTVYLDDVLAFPYPADILINYNIYAKRGDYESLYSGENVTMPRLLLGTKYVPLRKEFQLSEVLPVREPMENILVSVGGADPEHMALKFLNCFIQDRELAGRCQFHFILNSLEPDKEEIKEIAARHPWIVLHENVQRMSELMLKSDLAVSAAGSTLYELSACGVPAITYVLADNQILGAAEFEAQGIMINAGDCRKKPDFLAGVCRELKRLAADCGRRKDMAEKGRKAMDAAGAERIVRETVIQ
ncbi:UDP-2,4-diacetamido-2,4,6-trideoxy-beta-L-altropyranose hydrolase [Petralouisia muris]|uniref:UDP-2,4-diacetamido-2,4, 6-trideoxy-beta-L-altropyranose hydrolase n=1 Tax=Petralouisia muris TaxID=3032872 RepID=A0AC61S112_9FIRM|nr:UDP-2,4-diacetamido-2,4,6-trideoxy-beta-L-altropyranose hydrolase [Petralouisia muris]TGY97662.1 UDP-2,4-diacetamido-2,4,6-trideoxy-beta-L-altropyranose hydrolase [Petralouisia muris]